MYGMQLLDSITVVHGLLSTIKIILCYLSVTESSICLFCHMRRVLTLTSSSLKTLTLRSLTLTSWLTSRKYLVPVSVCSVSFILLSNRQWSENNNSLAECTWRRILIAFKNMHAYTRGKGEGGGNWWMWWNGQFFGYILAGTKFECAIFHKVSQHHPTILGPTWPLHNKLIGHVPKNWSLIIWQISQIFSTEYHFAEKTCDICWIVKPFSFWGLANRL